jgi:hypothetical protein
MKLVLDIQDADAAIGQRFADVLVRSAAAKLTVTARGRRVVIVREDSLKRIEATLPFTFTTDPERIDGALRVTIHPKPSTRKVSP